VSTPEVFVHASGDLLASAAAARTVTRLADAIAAQGHAHLVVTGGGIGTKVLAAIAADPARDAVDWRLVDFWWGDERFENAGDPERNETGARAALLDALSVDPARVHAIPGPDGPDGDDPDAAAARYAAELALAAGPGPGAQGAGVPAFDVLMLGIGPEGHVASIFPEAPAAYATGTVVAVRNSPKPPPTRISLTFGAIQAAREVWILASGAEKADAVAEALSGVSQDKLPAAGARGRDRTLFLLDADAASKLLPASNRGHDRGQREHRDEEEHHSRPDAAVHDEERPHGDRDEDGDRAPPRRPYRRPRLLDRLGLQTRRMHQQRRGQRLLTVGEVAAEHRLYREVHGERAQVTPGPPRIGGRHPLLELVQGEAAGRVRLPERGDHRLPVNVRSANEVIGGHVADLPLGRQAFSMVQGRYQ